jgi:(2R)-ethylmalonyl-CoA mutase
MAMEAPRLDRPDRPWLMRTYAGHSSAAASNALFRRNLAKGQTGLSVAFDLPTQTGYDPDHELAAGEVGRVGVPVAHLGDMRALLDGIDLAEANTSMTINAPAMWLLALYAVVAEERGVPLATLAGTTQNDIVKEYLSRGTYIFPPSPSLRLTTDTIAWAVTNTPQWNPVNICSYHLQEAGATPVQEVGFALATGLAVLDAVRDSGQVPPERMSDVVARISFFVNAGVRFVEEMCKMRAFAALWDQLVAQRYGVSDPAARRFRYGVQVNSLGLTEAQPENNVQRIVLETLGVTLSRDARARAVQLPAWNEALGLPRPWDQQWSLRIQQVLAFESDLLEYPDLFRGSHVVEALTSPSWTVPGPSWTGAGDGRRGGRGRVRLPQERAGRLAGRAPARGRVGRGGRGRRQPVHRDRAVAAGRAGAAPVELVDPQVEADAIEAVKAVARAARRGRRRGPGRAARGRRDRDNLMAATLRCVRAGVTTGEWAGVLREVFGEYRAPTGLGAARRSVRHVARRWRGTGAGAGDRGRARHRAAAAAGRQARPRRSFQRGRADRRAGP